MARTLSRDPFKNFRFKVYFDNPNNERPVAGVSQVSGLSWKVETVTRREGGDYQGERKLPGQVLYDPVTLSRGITNKRSFQEWAENVWHYGRYNPLGNMKKTLRIALCNENGKMVILFTLEDCWVSSYQPLPSLSSAGNEIAIESITVEHGGWTQQILE